jgi:hypothetical protein
MNVTVFCEVTPCTLVGRYHHYGKSTTFVFRAADEGNIFFRKVGSDLPDYTASQPITVILKASNE